MLKKLLPLLLLTFFLAFFSVSHAEIVYQYELTNGGETTIGENKDICPVPDMAGDYDFTDPCIKTLKIFRIGKHGKEGAFDHQGKIVIPIQYDTVNTFYTDTAGVKRGGKWALISRQGKLITPFIYDEIEDFAEHIPLAVVKQGEKYGVINNHATPIIPIAFDTIHSLAVVEDNNARVFLVQKVDKWAVFVKTGKRLTDFIFDDFKLGYYFYNGVLGAKADGKWGYINPQGDWVIPPMYKDVDTAVLGLLAVEGEKGIGFVDKYNKVMIPLIYDTFWKEEATGKIRVKSGTTFYLYDKNGKPLSE